MVRWVVQSNLGKEEDVQSIRDACADQCWGFVAVDAIPFSDDLPDVSESGDLTVFYGATRWINTIYESDKWTPGTFFNPECVFTHWIEKYKGHALNYGAKETTLEDFGSVADDYGDEVFVRPVSDQKEFAGQVIKKSEIKSWAEKVQTDVPDFAKVPIVVGEPYGISEEWRLFMVDNKVSAGSRYRRYHKLAPHPEVPQEVVEFAEARAKEYSPAGVFVMDVGRSGESLYVIEIGCFNSAGFYASDISKIVKDVSEFCER
jgi:hypothetical protein